MHDSIYCDNQGIIALSKKKTSTSNIQNTQICHFIESGQNCQQSRTILCQKKMTLIYLLEISEE